MELSFFVQKLVSKFAGWQNEEEDNIMTDKVKEIISQLEDGVDGIIVPMENDKCAAALADIFQDEERQRVLVRNEMRKDYTNAGGLQKLYKLL